MPRFTRRIKKSARRSTPRKQKGGTLEQIKAFMKDSLKEAELNDLISHISKETADALNRSLLLPFAADKGWVPVVKAILAKRGIDVNVPDEDGITALGHATTKYTQETQKNEPEEDTPAQQIFELLIEHPDISIEEIDDDGDKTGKLLKDKATHMTILEVAGEQQIIDIFRNVDSTIQRYLIGAGLLNIDDDDQSSKSSSAGDNIPDEVTKFIKAAFPATEFGETLRKKIQPNLQTVVEYIVGDKKEATLKVGTAEIKLTEDIMNPLTRELLTEFLRSFLKV
jgi:hypothetical protein